MKRSRFIKNACLSLGAALVLAACGGGGEEAATAPDGEIAAATSGPWVVGTEPAFPPFESQSDSGELVGFDIDLLRAIGDQAGVEIEFESLPFDGLIPALQAGTIEAAVSGMTITEERAATVDFSRPYFRAGLAIAIAEEDAEITSIETLEGKKIAVQIGTTGAEMAGGIKDAKVSTFDSAPLALQELANGNADAVINDAPATLDAIATGNIGGIKVVGELLTEEFYGIAMPKDSPNLEILNTALTEIIENGTYDTIYEKWFGTAPVGTLPETAF
ncbi:basic amino acid ABC transporter substrate-binding protein [Leptolyngbya cf. ectocarpi LEGE 11479]|uniref:Basic amino acid ABC transporter substrate-binding protein n=1 Tax=Leptolyngbya cf. ectocarpi LEGE 11479 TaxID=1828722 RepID=A0A928WYM6_LEPEC|nr:basic amino acid ABC transporter substrate-binding protein [Leptolyngbya ectocarpi]MBE9065252.1 basic amino acid ABC transporter substrate-binding protein [Leptolyngbya cf. ectocarpi LEGE 11479]